MNQMQTVQHNNGRTNQIGAHIRRLDRNQAATNAMQHMQAMQRAGCILCGAPPALVGVFIPDDPATFGGQAGKQRVIAYAICEPCARGNRAEEVEAIFKQKLTTAQGGTAT